MLNILPRTAVFTFGRWNPLHLGHTLIVNKMREYVYSHNAWPVIFLSHTQDSDRNPLSWEEKAEFVRSAYKDVSIYRRSDVKNPYSALEFLGTQGFDKVIFVCGSDRFVSFQSMKDYQEKFNIPQIEVVSAGWRDPTAEDIVGISATKLRRLCKDGVLHEAVALMPRSLPMNDKVRLFNILHERLNAPVNTP